MRDLGSQRRLARLLARFERGLLPVAGLFLVPLLILGDGSKANAAGFNSWPRPKGIAHCWTSLFDQYGANMLKVTQTVSIDNAWVDYRVFLKNGEEKALVCHPASGKVSEAGQQR